ncbi:MAG: response regulator [Scytonematopsis contorta HA4267-MV1]|jgi:chemotaxis family two-component system sensor histidine kinase/response regulator PixL|nr:response regulator [Scytonematopsis contorta HA4267-MV1]
MLTDSSIREQGYIYFLSEAPELLHTIERELFNLSENRSIATVHNLMRATHTIKGGAANVGLETINKVAHSLEDIFKAFYNPDVTINSEILALLFQAYECLQLPLTAELNGAPINTEEILQRATFVFAQLQEKLGDAFDTETHIPTSEELGFDIVKSIFESGVSQRIQSVTEALENIQDDTELVEFLRSQAEVFVGLAESLNLPGFGRIAQTTLVALGINPGKVRNIGECFLVDLQQAREAVLIGDRTKGGEVSITLQKFALSTDLATDLATDDVTDVTDVTDVLSVGFKDVSSVSSANKFVAQPSIDKFLRKEIEEFYKFLITKGKSNAQPLKPVVAKFYLKVIRYIFGWFNHYNNISDKEFSLYLLMPDYELDKLNQYVQSWLNSFLEFSRDKNDSPSLSIYRRGVVLNILISVAKFQSLPNNYTHQRDGIVSIILILEKQIIQLGKEYKNYNPVTLTEKNWIDRPKFKELLITKEITHYIPPLVEDDNNLVETIWGESSSQNFSSQENSQENRQEYLNNQQQSENINKNPNEITNLDNDAENLELYTFIQKDIQNYNAINIPLTNENLQDNNKQLKVKDDKPETSPTQNSRQRSFVRVDVDGLQRLNYIAGELLIYQKRCFLYDEQIQELTERLSQQLVRHQTTLNKLGELPRLTQNLTSQNRLNFAAVDFDSLEMDEYTEFYLQLHEATEETLQLQETTESLDLIIRQSIQIADKKQHIILNIIDNLVEARMLPLGEILNRFPHMIKNLGNVYSKNVEMKLYGTEVLIDKAIAEKLYDPLLHLVRNAFDHGIEIPEIRNHRNKPEKGLIEIHAYHQGSQTIIEVRDDGQGLNFENIRKKANELGLIPPLDTDNTYYSNPSEEELLEILFSPGFTTAGKVSEISGRGIGLDIVRSQLESLDGSIAVKSISGKGTVFILKIPFSMTTDKLMLVQTGGITYALLLGCIEKILIPTSEQIKEFEGKKVLHWSSGKDERMVSIRKLSDLIAYNCSFIPSVLGNQFTNNENFTINKVNPILLLRHNQEIFALEVEQIFGEQELVIRPLSNTIPPPRYIYGCSSLPNGNLILVIDGTVLLGSYEMQAKLDIITLPTHAHPKKALPPSPINNQSTPLLTASTNKNSIIKTQKLSKVVLVVDDAISLRQTLSLTLQKYGYQVLQAQNGVEALEQLELHPEICLVVSDLEMPRMNGFELLSNIRENQKLAKKPVIVLTSRSAEKHRQLAEALGALAYMTKPYLENELIANVESLVATNLQF